MAYGPRNPVYIRGIKAGVLQDSTWWRLLELRREIHREAEKILYSRLRFGKWNYN
jgi:hypothetical protein